MSNIPTFDDLRLPFELFKAPIAHAWIDPAGTCAHCGSAEDARFYELCYSCLRNDLNDSAIDTELGMVTREFAEQGMTHGLPLGDPAEYELYGTSAHPVAPDFPDETWFHIHVAEKWLRELLRTPRYSTWQGECWLFCCRRPMVFRASLPGDLLGDSEADILVAMQRFLDRPRWEDTIGGGHNSHTYYVFFCPDCGCLRYHDDCD